MSRRVLTVSVASVITVVMVFFAFHRTVPYAIESPGPVFDTLGTVSANGPAVVQVTGAKTYNSGGHIYLTTVDVYPGDCTGGPHLADAIKAWFDKSEAVVPIEAECPPSQSSGDVALTDETDMATSQINAETAAAAALGIKVIGHEVIIAGVEPGYPAAHFLKPEDIIDSIDGTAITRPQQAVTAVQSHPVGTALHFVVTRGTKQLSATITSVATPTSNGGTDPKTAFVGFTPSPRPLFKGVSLNIGINPDQVGGPSAGTALALGIIDKLTPGGITGGRTIAGTGTITKSGTIGEIGGIQQKVVAADRAGAAVFFAPAANCSDAKSVAPSSMTLIKAETLSEVVQALKDINTGNTDFPHC